MTSNKPERCCVSGPVVQGVSRGSITTVAGIETYISHPPTNASRCNKALLFLTEANGIHILTDQLLADRFATAGYTVVMPDLFHGDAHGLNDTSTDLYEWLDRHPAERVDPVIASTLSMMRHDMGFDRVGAVGYCFGAKYVIRWLSDNDKKIDAGFVAHPSFVEREELATIRGPLAIAAAESDYIFTVEKRRESEAILNGLDIAWHISLYSDVRHSFAVRRVDTKQRERWAKEEAFQLALRWFKEHL